MSDFSLDALRVPQRGEVRIRALAEAVGEELLAGSRHLRGRDFERIHADDLAELLAIYDRRFLGGAIRRLLGGESLSFRLSRRMSSAGGSTSWQRAPAGGMSYQITVSTAILFEGFGPDDREATASGLPCPHRLDALQRIMEHEITHLLEALCSGKSSCRARPFQDFASGVFGHRTHTHNLITRKERAALEGFAPGARVSFDFAGAKLAGRVNRITKRATVLVEDATGQRYSDGRRYAKYYVPITALKPDGSGPSG